MKRILTVSLVGISSSDKQGGFPIEGGRGHKKRIKDSKCTKNVPKLAKPATETRLLMLWPG